MQIEPRLNNWVIQYDFISTAMKEPVPKIEQNSPLGCFSSKFYTNLDYNITSKQKISVNSSLKKKKKTRKSHKNYSLILPFWGNIPFPTDTWRL